MNSIEHKKTKSINFGPQSYPCFNCFFNIINDNNNLKYKTNNTRSPQNNLGKNQRKRNLIGNIVGKDHVMTNKMSLSSIRKKNTTNTSNNSNNKYIFN